MKLSRWRKESVAAIQRWDEEPLLAELGRRRFQRVECVDAFLTRVEETIPAAPAAALRLGERGPEYARQAGVDFEARAWCLLGHAQKTLGDLPGATRTFGQALKVLDGRESAEAASVWWHYSGFLGDQGRSEEALVYSRKAVDYFRLHREDLEVDSCDRLSLAAALNREAILLEKMGWKTSDVAKLFLRALQETNERTPRTAAVVSKNFAVAAVIGWMEGESGFLAGEVLRRIKGVRRDLGSLGYDRHTLWGARLQWVEGMGMAHLAGGLTPAAEHHIQTSRATLLDLGARHDVILLNLDEGYWLIKEGEWERLTDLALETLDLAVLVGLECEQLAAMRQWLASVERRSVEAVVLNDVYREVRGVRSLDLGISKVDDLSPTGW